MNYGAGSHEEVHKSGQFAIRYRITVADITCEPVAATSGGQSPLVPRPTDPAQVAVDCQRTQ